MTILFVTFCNSVSMLLVVCLLCARCQAETSTYLYSYSISASPYPGTTVSYPMSILGGGLICGGSTITIDGCDSGFGDTYLQLFTAGDNSPIAAIDDGCFYSYGSYMTYVVPSTAQCQYYTAKIGCIKGTSIYCVYCADPCSGFVTETTETVGRFCRYLDIRMYDTSKISQIFVVK